MIRFHLCAPAARLPSSCRGAGRAIRAAVLAAFLRPSLRRAQGLLRTGLLAGFLMPALAGCAGLGELVGAYGGEEGLALLRKAAEGAEKIEDATIGNAVKVLPVYCVAPGAARTAFRARINARPEAEGAKVGVWCPGDAPLVLGP